MKTSCIFCWLFMAFQLSSFAQEIQKKAPQCGTLSPTLKQIEKLPYYKNAQYLIDEAIEKGLEIEKDYLQKLNNSNVGQSYADYKKSLPESSQAKAFSSSSHYYIPVKAYIWANSSGTLPFTGPQVENEIDQVNQFFEDNAVPITLYLQCGVLVGANNSYYDVRSDNDYDDMVDFPGPANTLRVHFVNSMIIDGTALSGRARLPSSSNPYRCAISSGASDHTLTHEIGHNLGLFHTHDGGRSNNSSNRDCSKCYQESVSRTRKQGIGCLQTSGWKKCEVNGDFLCDTPADPNLFYDKVIRLNPSSCNYDGTLGNDKWGAAWQPDEGNIMSYSFGNGNTCRSTFTPQQAAVMVLFLPSFATSSPGYFISGPSKLCPNQSATYSVPATSGASDYQWEIPSGWTISGQGNHTVTITASSNSRGTIRVAPSCGRPPVSKSISNQLSSIAVNGPYTVCEGEYVTYSTSATGGSYTWSVMGNLQIHSGQGSSNVQIYVPYGSSGGYVSVNVNFGSCSGTNGRGVSVSSGSNCYSSLVTDDSISFEYIEEEQKQDVPTKSMRTESSDQVLDVLVYPNPSNQQINLSFNKKGTYHIELMDKQGQVVAEQESMNGKESIDVSALSEGLYYLRICLGSAVLTKKVFIE
ncbi:T9SS type A sorting domain-containing protein [Tunicatimonas pelagia]|uniref:T9SS type A sorting domain-containing protein n=1 Tax=Tunicatimonas pelagia TaxID=931531 RepID=UPI002665AD21|nr:T9SS type A sorting domain-containing protein [Tunicatimonas pelagia]WKN46284.1 T9SS type A sorting domain-containing protein [Tunicatimonas pelagia]